METQKQDIYKNDAREACDRRVRILCKILNTKEAYTVGDWIMEDPLEQIYARCDALDLTIALAMRLVNEKGA